MKATILAVGFLAGLEVLLGSQLPLQACGGDAVSLSTLAQEAVSTNADVAGHAITALRQQGPAGLDALCEAHAALIHQHTTPTFPAGATNDTAAWSRLRAALDQVSGQRDDYASQLYWYTDLDQAEAAAKASGKPILSLRLLGRLDEEYSCANSRFFRTTLYPNAEIAAYLRQHFVLHWQSVRPVPRITIDFGDGRKIEETITGNSIHYVLAPNGQVIDALPGLYGPKAFLKGLAVAEKASARYASLNESDGYAYLKAYHRENLDALLATWQNDLQKDPLITGDIGSSKSPRNIPVDNEVWHRIASLHTEDAQLDAGARQLIQAKNSFASVAGGLAVSKAAVENPMMRQIRNFQRSISEDTVRNEYRFHSAIHEWLAADPVSGGLNRLNQRVYAELFLTPDSDPWLGLAPSTFTGLENDGLVWNPR